MPEPRTKPATDTAKNPAADQALVGGGQKLQQSSLRRGKGQHSQLCTVCSRPIQLLSFSKVKSVGGKQVWLPT